MAEVSLGLVPDLGGTTPLVRLVGYARALEICATGRRVGAEEALAMGLANLVVPPEDLDDAVRDLTAALLSGARDAVVEIKALLAGAPTAATGPRSYRPSARRRYGGFVTSPASASDHSAQRITPDQLDDCCVG